jgi:hypothetical protein
MAGIFDRILELSKRVDLTKQNSYFDHGASMVLPWCFHAVPSYLRLSEGYLFCSNKALAGDRKFGRQSWIKNKAKLNQI